MIVRLMPHEVADVEPLLSLLSKQSPSDYQVLVSCSYDLACIFITKDY